MEQHGAIMLHAASQLALKADQTDAASRVFHVLQAQLQGVDAILLSSQSVTLNKEHVQCNVHWLEVGEVHFLEQAARKLFHVSVLRLQFRLHHILLDPSSDLIIIRRRPE